MEVSNITVPMQDDVIHQNSNVLLPLSKFQLRFFTFTIILPLQMSPTVRQQLQRELTSHPHCTSVIFM